MEERKLRRDRAMLDGGCTAAIYETATTEAATKEAATMEAATTEAATSEAKACVASKGDGDTQQSIGVGSSCTWVRLEEESASCGGDGCRGGRDGHGGGGDAEARDGWKDGGRWVQGPSRAKEIGGGKE